MLDYKNVVDMLNNKIDEDTNMGECSYFCYYSNSVSEGIEFWYEDNKLPIWNSEDDDFSSWCMHDEDYTEGMMVMWIILKMKKTVSELVEFVNDMNELRR